jgi:2-polyprenyl-3-methyl-5-hydroxy-6-metoxy-1,4-benzoquinol methylase
MKTKKTNHKVFDYEDVIMGLDTKAAFDEGQVSGTDVRLTRLLEAFPTMKGKVLDVGSGGGSITEYLARVYPKTNVYGADVSVAAIGLAKRNPQSRASYSVIRKGKLAYQSNTFDVCVCFDVLEHVPDMNDFLSEIHRVLKKGGVFFMAVPCEGQFMSLTWLLMRFGVGNHLTYKHVGHIHPEFTHEFIKGLLVGHGFSIGRVSFSEHFITQCVRFIRFILPKELLELVIGSKKASGYYDRGVLRNQKKRKTIDIFMLLRKIWLGLGVVFDFIEHAEARIFKRTGFAAWKLIIESKKSL